MKVYLDVCLSELFLVSPRAENRVLNQRDQKLVYRLAPECGARGIEILGKQV